MKTWVLFQYKLHRKWVPLWKPGIHWNISVPQVIPRAYEQCFDVIIASKLAIWSVNIWWKMRNIIVGSLASLNFCIRRLWKLSLILLVYFLQLKLSFYNSLYICTSHESLFKLSNAFSFRMCYQILYKRVCA